MPFAGREILPRNVYGVAYEECQKQGVLRAELVARQLLATSMFEAGNYSKKRDAYRNTLRVKGLTEAEIDKQAPRYFVLYEKATFINKDGSVDRGIFMMNDKYQPQVTDEEAFNYTESCREAVTLYRRAGLNPWYGWKDIMSPVAIYKMKTDPEYPFKSHLDGAINRWQRACMAENNYNLVQMGLPPISVASLA